MLGRPGPSHDVATLCVTAMTGGPGRDLESEMLKPKHTEAKRLCEGLTRACEAGEGVGFRSVLRHLKDVCDEPRK